MEGGARGTLLSLGCGVVAASERRRVRRIRRLRDCDVSCMMAIDRRSGVTHGGCEGIYGRRRCRTGVVVV